MRPGVQSAVDPHPLCPLPQTGAQLLPQPSAKLSPQCLLAQLPMHASLPLMLTLSIASACALSPLFDVGEFSV
jgi:hypothetical protein